MYISALEVVYTLCVDEAAHQAQLSWSKAQTVLFADLCFIKCA